MLRVLLVALVVFATIYAFVDCVQTDRRLVADDAQARLALAVLVPVARADRLARGRASRRARRSRATQGRGAGRPAREAREGHSDPTTTPTSSASCRRTPQNSMATLSQWIEGARPRTLPAAVSPIARRHRRRLPDRSRRLGVCRARPRRGPGPPGRGQLRQRLLRRHPRHRRGAGRAGAARRPAPRRARRRSRSRPSRASSSRALVGLALVGRSRPVGDDPDRRGLPSWRPGTTPAGDGPTATSGSARSSSSSSSGWSRRSARWRR